MNGHSVGGLAALSFAVFTMTASPAAAQEDQPPITAPPASQPVARPPSSAPAVQITPRPSLESDQEDPPGAVIRKTADPGDASAEPVIRAEGGNIGLFFRFGGLATLTASGSSRAVNQLLVTQVGLKIVFSERWMLPITVGTGFRVVDPDTSSSSSSSDGDSQTDVGFDLGVGFERHFRIWRRISPFVGFGVGVGVVNPGGDDRADEKKTVGFSFGPSLGIEYYIADRVSVTAQYLFMFQFEWADERYSAFQLSSLAGGALNLSCYF